MRYQIVNRFPTESGLVELKDGEIPVGVDWTRMVVQVPGAKEGEPPVNTIVAKQALLVLTPVSV